ncbi:hypothetical protein [Erythrobacter sp. MTPC3]|uniref:hypothetical protein n=1 Tax=Erythrobacter sp. MTPC3 TaxID=3056564 RepID=UPI0036F1F39D
MKNVLGGDTVAALPETGAVAVNTTTNYLKQDANLLSDSIVTDHDIPALSQ